MHPHRHGSNIPSGPRRKLPWLFPRFDTSFDKEIADLEFWRLYVRCMGRRFLPHTRRELHYLVG